MNSTINDQMHAVPGVPTTLAPVPESSELPEGVREVRFSDTHGYDVMVLHDVPYVDREGVALTLQMLLPRERPFQEETIEKWPLVVFVQGSGWRKQNLYANYPLILRMCQRGYTMAIVEYRASDDAPFPAQIEDAKAAVRYLRKNADLYRIDKDRIAIWGDSSGAHTAVMTAVTGDRLFVTDDYAEEPLSLRCVVDWFGPVDINKMADYPSAADHTAPDSPEGILFGGVDVKLHPEKADIASPLKYICKEQPLPPFLIMHGGSDALVPFNQSVRLYEKLRACGKDVRFYKLIGANHGFDGFHCDEALDLVEAFLKEYL